MNSTLTTNPDTDEMAAREEIVHRFSNSVVMTQLIRQAVREAVLEHRRVGNPIATMREGQVIIVQPEDIQMAQE